jgi:hypothetical protein
MKFVKSPAPPGFFFLTVELTPAIEAGCPPQYTRAAVVSLDAILPHVKHCPHSQRNFFCSIEPVLRSALAQSDAKGGYPEKESGKASHH